MRNVILQYVEKENQSSQSLRDTPPPRALGAPPSSSVYDCSGLTLSRQVPWENLRCGRGSARGHSGVGVSVQAPGEPDPAVTVLPQALAAQLPNVCPRGMHTGLTQTCE